MFHAVVRYTVNYERVTPPSKDEEIRLLPALVKAIVIILVVPLFLLFVVTYIERFLWDLVVNQN